MESADLLWRENTCSVEGYIPVVEGTGLLWREQTCCGGYRPAV